MRKFILSIIVTLSIISTIIIVGLMIYDNSFDHQNKPKNVIRQNKKPIKTPLEKTTENSRKEISSTKSLEKSSIIELHRNNKPSAWGDKIDGIYYKLDTKEKLIALTFDACGGSSKSSGYDHDLVDYLIKEKIPATLFVTKMWIENNKDTFLKLANNPLFEIGNHGTHHRPLSVIPREIYGIKSTQSIEDVYDEIVTNEKYITQLTEKKPKYFRSGTAYTDDASLKLLSDMGIQFIGYDVTGDAGASLSTDEIVKQMKTVTPGSIVLMHFNRPDKETFEGLVKSIPILRQQGYKFVRLSDYKLIDKR